MSFLDDLRPHFAACAFCSFSFAPNLDSLGFLSIFEQMQDNLLNTDFVEECC